MNTAVRSTVREPLRRPEPVDDLQLSTSVEDIRAAVVHERFTEYAGSERVVNALAQMWPAAPVLAPIVKTGALPATLRGRVSPGRLDRFVPDSGTYAHLLPVLPTAMRHLEVPVDIDVVLASHHAFASQVVHATDVPVVAYVHSPARWIWDSAMRRGEFGGAVGNLGLGAFSAAFRGSDRKAAGRLRGIVVNSTAVGRRVEQWWGQESSVVAPPVDTDFYSPDPALPREDFFLLAGRLVPYKRPGLAVAAARRAGVRLVVAGDGRAREEAEALAGPETTFLGRVDDETQRDLYRRCSALLMPGVEDFGIVPVEAMACGAPVIAVAAGGALDSVRPGVSGQLVDSADRPDPEAVALWAEALSTFSPEAYRTAAVRAHAERFSPAAFEAAMARVVRAALA